MLASLQLWVPASIVQHNPMCCCDADTGQKASSPAIGCSRQREGQLTPPEKKASRSYSMLPCHGRYRCQLASRRWSVAGSRGAYAWRAVSRMCCSCILDAVDTPLSPHAGRICWLVNSAVARAAAVRCMTRSPLALQSVAAQRQRDVSWWRVVESEQTGSNTGLHTVRVPWSARQNRAEQSCRIDGGGFR